MEILKEGGEGARRQTERNISTEEMTDLHSTREVMGGGKMDPVRGLSFEVKLRGFIQLEKSSLESRLKRERKRERREPISAPGSLLSFLALFSFLRCGCH